MALLPSDHQREFCDRGYTVFPGVLTPAQVAAAIPLFDGIITSQTRPPVVTGDDSSRRQLNSSRYCVPGLSNYGGLPAVMETARIVLGRECRLTRSPVPSVTYPGVAGGKPEISGAWSGHVDWDPTGDVNLLYAYGIMHFTTVKPTGGGFTVVPGSHRAVAQLLADTFASARMFTQDFSGLSLNPPLEITAQAGDILYYHPLLVHGASDNRLTVARKVLHTHYYPILAPAVEERLLKTRESGFHPDHLAAMDDAMRQCCGLAAATR